jgi:hypothetical protein
VGKVRIQYRASTISLQAAVHPEYALGALNMKEEEETYYLRICLSHGCKNPRRLVTWTNKFCIVMPTTLSIILLFFPLHTNRCIISNELSRKH